MQSGYGHVNAMCHTAPMPHPDTWLKPLPQGLYCEPGGFFIDPSRVVDRAVITHAHSDHARPGHKAVLATRETLALMLARMGAKRAGGQLQALAYGDTIGIDGVKLWLQPAGHVLGSAQIAIEYRGTRVVVSGDYKRTPDPTCAPFEPIACDVFVTEATFGLPIFLHPPPEQEIARLLTSVTLFPERTHVVGCYSLGKCQRMIALLRRAGWDAPVYLHPALLAMSQVYRDHGIALGDIQPLRITDRLAGAIVLAPPGSAVPLAKNPLIVAASGWMRVRQRAKASGAELPLIVSDHADWAELNRTIDDTGAAEVRVTHGWEAPLIHAAAQRGIKGRALRLIGYGEEDDAEETVA